MFTSRRDELKELLEPIKRRLLLRQLVRALARCSLWAMGAGVLLLLAARLFPIPYYPPLTVGLLLMAIGGGAVYTWYQAPGWERAAREADRFGLAERVMTAWENREHASPMAALQREDTVRLLRRQLPEILRHFPVWTYPRRSVGLYASVAGLWLLLLFMPNPMDRILHERALTAQASETVEKRIAKAVEEAQKNDQLTAEQKQELTAVLDDLKQELKEKESLVEKLNALEKAEKELLAIQEKELKKQHALLRMQQKLAQNEALKDVAQALAKEDQQALLKAMQEIAKLVDSFSAQQQEELARLMEEMAEMALESGGGEADLQQIAEQLRQAAANLRDGHLPQSFEEMKEAFVQAMQQQAQMQNMRFQMAGALAALQQSQQNLGQAAAGTGSGGAGMPGQAGNGTPGTASSGQGVPGSSPATGQGSSQGSAQAQGSGQGQGSGQSQGNGQGAGQGQGQGNGTGTGGTGSGSGGSGAGLGARSHELVNVPSERIAGDGPADTVGGPLGEGASETRQSSQARVSPGVARPYAEVFREYEQMARDSLERQSIPADYQDMVKDYFTKIEP